MRTSSALSLLYADMYGFGELKRDYGVYTYRMKTHSISYGDNPRQRLDIYSASDASEALRAVIIFCYGGSWRRGRKATYTFMGRALAKMGYIVVIPDYRLYPEVTFPAFVDDYAASVGWTHQHIREFGGDPNHLFLMGHSAGAHIASLAAVDKRYLAKARVPQAAIGGYIGLSGPYDFYPGPSYRPVFPNLKTDSSWSPIAKIDSPKMPFLLLHGRLDHVVRLSNSRNFGAAINKAGGTATVKLYPLFEHMGILLPFLPGLGWIGGMRRTVRHFINSAVAQS